LCVCLGLVLALLGRFLNLSKIYVVVGAPEADDVLRLMNTS
jgi:hypothetical protein